MKNIKKIMLMVLCAVMACVMMTGCSSKFVGTWKSVAIEEGGEKHTASDETYGEIVKGFMTIEVEKGGEGTVKALGESNDMKWEADGDTITVTVDGDDLDFTLKDDQLVADVDGTKVYLEKDE